MKKIVLLLMLFIGGYTYGQKWDTIVCKDGNKVPCRIVEVGDVDVFYKFTYDTTGHSYKMHLKNVERVVFWGAKSIQYVNKTLEIPKNKVEYNIETLSKKVEALENNINTNIRIQNYAGYHLNMAATYSYLAISATIVSGVVSLVGALNNYNKPILIVSGIIAGASLCFTIGIPIQLNKAGNTLIRQK
jgi:hypothetical protein